MTVEMQLRDIARALVGSGRGILAADESTGTIKRRFDSINVESSFENRRDYREMLFATEGASQFISGVILYDETIRQQNREGKLLVDILREQGIMPGIKVDKSTNPLAGAGGEVITDGLDGLRGRLDEYVKLGAKFTKWRAVINIGEDIPTSYGIGANAHALARFAGLSQEAGLVPIVEPEVLMDGDHSIEKCYEITELTLREVYYQLGNQNVRLDSTLLKPNMILSGKEASNRAGPKKVAQMTVECLKRTVPAAVPGIVFLSGGQGDEEATKNLNEINLYGAASNVPWELSFSFGRGLQASPLKAWGGRSENAQAAKQAFHKRAALTSLARQGKYDSID